VRGVAINTAEVEQVLLEHPDVLEAAVLARPDPLAGRRLVAAVQRTPASGLNSLALREHCATLRAGTTAPIAIGFGVRTRADLAAVHDCGADAVIVGSAGVARVKNALAAGHDVIADFRDFVRSIRPATPVHRT